MKTNVGIVFHMLFIETLVVRAKQSKPLLVIKSTNKSPFFQNENTNAVLPLKKIISLPIPNQEGKRILLFSSRVALGVGKEWQCGPK